MKYIIQNDILKSIKFAILILCILVLIQNTKVYIISVFIIMTQVWCLRNFEIQLYYIIENNTKIGLSIIYQHSFLIQFKFNIKKTT